jgi:hypothetical protein
MRNSEGVLERLGMTVVEHPETNYQVDIYLTESAKLINTIPYVDLHTFALGMEFCKQSQETKDE